MKVWQEHSEIVDGQWVQIRREVEMPDTVEAGAVDKVSEAALRPARIAALREILFDAIAAGEPLDPALQAEYAALKRETA